MMKPALLFLALVLILVAGSFAGNSKVFYRIQPVDSNEVDVACVLGEPPNVYAIGRASEGFLRDSTTQTVGGSPREMSRV
jgi:hypothetical protein